MSIFINRTRELSALDGRYLQGRAELIILYGRRRIGKSGLVDHFLTSTRGIRLLAREESKHLQLKRFSQELAAFFSDDFLATTSFTDWDSFFTYLAGKANDRFVIAIDEFPYLVKEDPSLPSILQDHWDRRLANSPAFLILSGSSIAMMEEMTMEHTSPLYGRRTGQILLRGLRFADVLDYIGDLTRAVEVYAVFGGTPAYLMAVDRSRDVFDNILHRILAFDAPLSRDVEFVLRMELNEPRYYFSILLSLAKGNNRIGLIMNDTGLDKGIITKYLSTLIDLQLVERRVPVTESKRSRKGIYVLSDNLFDFWFRFVYPSMEKIERGEGEIVLETSVRPQFAQYTGKHFEAMVRDLFHEFNGCGRLPFRFSALGTWWDKGEEIDLVALNDEEHAILFCECKWQEGVNADAELSRLREKSAAVAWNRGDRHEYFCIVARSFSARRAIPEPDDHTLFWDAEDLFRLHRECRAG